MPAHADIPTGSLNDDPASPYAPALPPELLDEILDYLQQTNWRARTFSTSHGPSRHLLAFRLVCKQWNIVSLPRVFSHLVVRDAVNRFEGFAIFLASPSISLPASHVQSLTMTSDISWSGGKPLLRSRVLREILSYLPYLEVLVLDSIRLGTSHSDSPPQPLFRYKARTLLRRCTLRLGRASPSVLRRVTSGNDDSQCRFTLKRLTLKQFSLRDGRAEQLMSALSIFSAIGRLEFMRIRDLRLPETAERAWRAGIEKTKAAPGPVVVQELIVDGTSNHLMVPTLKDTIDVQKIASMSVELPLVDNFFKMSAFLSSGSMTTGRAGVASNLLTDLTLDVSDVVLFADQAGTQDEHVANEALRTLCTALKDHTPHLHRFKLFFYLPDYESTWHRTVPLAFVSSMPTALGHITLHLEGNPEEMAHVGHPLAKACLGLEGLKSVSVVSDRVGFRDQEMEESVVRECAGLRERGILFLGVGPSCAESGCQTRRLDVLSPLLSRH